MAFTGNESEQITLEEAVTLTSNYRGTITSGDIKAHFVGKNKLLGLLNQEDCVGVRIYYGITDGGVKQIVLVGADENENDLYEGLILDRSIPCPNHCATDSPLND